MFVKNVRLRFLNASCRHSEWRKLAKKARRKRKRLEEALRREKTEVEERLNREKSPSYAAWFIEQQQLEEFQAAEELRIAKEKEAQYLERERLAQLQWQALQKKLQLAREERAKQNARIRVEWEAEQKRLKLLKEEKERQEEEKRVKQQELQQRIEEFLVSDAEMPEELNETLETNPGKATCPFFTKTAACRFGDMCSRNHIRPTISRILLIKNFYSHYSLDTKDTEHGDSSLEFESKETYAHFKLFFHDVVPEMEKFGVVRQFKVCCNKEAHLRGNVYVEYANFREAMRSYRRFYGRYYASKQLNVEFCKIDSWKSAICGLFFRKRCPKGSVCNFLHVFRNPANLFMKADRDLHRTPPEIDSFENSVNSERRDWRWSESPERPQLETPNSSERLRKEHDKENGHRKRSRSRSSSRRHRNSSSRSSRSEIKTSRSRSSSKTSSKARHRSRSSSDNKRRRSSRSSNSSTRK